jgi:hypothetical protein
MSYNQLPLEDKEYAVDVIKKSNWKIYKQVFLGGFEHEDKE